MSDSFCREDGAEESEVRVGFVTYAKQIHFYNVKVRKMNNRMTLNSIKMYKNLPVHPLLCT